MLPELVRVGAATPGEHGGALLRVLHVMLHQDCSTRLVSRGGDLACLRVGPREILQAAGHRLGGNLTPPEGAEGFRERGEHPRQVARYGSDRARAC